MKSEDRIQASNDFQSGVIDFKQYMKQTDKYWSAVASKLLRRFVVPKAVEFEDLKQELFMAVWKLFKIWDPNREKVQELSKYITHYAVKQALDWLHEQRLDIEENGEQVSKFDISPKEVLDEDSISEDPSQEVSFSIKEKIQLTFDKLSKKNTLRNRKASYILSLVMKYDGDLEQVIDDIRRDDKFKFMIKASDDNSIEKAIRETLKIVEEMNI